ncbi:hypothetical protein [Paenibacillus xylaniclasticus]|uniref:hypothetical protein n=1 Tax=Paenibacillus xylaniclasticus TaxID=588083 RepID=UPI000FD85338|nr:MULTISPECIES: hypothetical protein [Paenibacillus]GFN32732.1 hypothetical protein PCURB6_29920 [Paenibacillus curdlanolyticus]
MNPKMLLLYLLCAAAVGAGLLMPHIQWWMKLILFAGLVYLEIAQDELTRRQKYMVLSLFAAGIMAGYGIKAWGD